jgi:hypothetical protein
MLIQPLPISLLAKVDFIRRRDLLIEIHTSIYVVLELRNGI